MVHVHQPCCQKQWRQHSQNTLVQQQACEALLHHTRKDNGVKIAEEGEVDRVIAAMVAPLAVVGL